jgi:hypothetical protein
MRPPSRYFFAKYIKAEFAQIVKRSNDIFAGKVITAGVML